MQSPPIDVRDRDRYDVEQLAIKDTYEEDLDSVLITGGEVSDRVSKLAQEITHEYNNREDPAFYPVCVLKGAMRFFGELLSDLNLDIPYSEGVVRASRYKAGQAEGIEADVQFLQPSAIEGRDLLLVEDIIDEGYTLEAILEHVQQYNPNSVEIAALFDKRANREADIEPAYTGFIIPDEFVVGYGLDFDERYRDMNHLGVLQPELLDVDPE